MKWFNKPKTFFKEYIFRNLFDYYYKANDTYQDSEGKGILERFIEVCSSYFDNEIMPDIDNFMYCLDIDKTNPIFINYLWEYFGFIPYSYGVITRGEPYTESNLEDWIKADRGFPTADPRIILKYAISLYKIRGTQKFYEILGRLYGVTLTLQEKWEFEYLQWLANNPESTESEKQKSKEYYKTQNNPSLLGSVSFDSTSYYDGKSTTFDTETDCWECVPMVLTIGIPMGTWNNLLYRDTQIQEMLLNEWKLQNPLASEEEIENQRQQIIKDHPSDYSDRAKKALISIINKYLPVNVKYFDPDSGDVIFQETTVLIVITRPI